ncbi:MAG: hypothetical protein QXL02_03055 [Candidatus Anstonellales archaeon]
MDPVGLDISYELIPIRASKTDDFIVLLLNVKNVDKRKKLISIDVVSNNDQIYLDSYRARKKEEFRLGILSEKESREIPVKLFLQKPSARPGLYDISIISYLHDRDYESYIEKSEFKIQVRVV